MGGDGDFVRKFEGNRMNIAAFETEMGMGITNAFPQSPDVNDTNYR